MADSPAPQPRWWHSTAIYHIYPRSFLDTNGDGIGDLPGIIEKLPYIRDLGVGAIWMGPVFPSPQVDNGYDIRDYQDIDPLFGSLKDMDRLIERAHQLGLRVLLDLVFNHTSDRHRWFCMSRDDPAGPYGDFYIWRDGPDIPNDWWGFFSTPAWTWSEQRQQYYLHLFAPEQPDLNWENPRVRQELAGAANFWVDRGVDGFRMDVINLISKDPENPAGGYIDGPKVPEFLREFRQSLHRSEELLLVGETPGISPEAARRYTDPNHPALDLLLQFDHVSVDHGPSGRWEPAPLAIPALAAVLARGQEMLAPPRRPCIYFGNHDQPRGVSRFGDDGQFRRQSAIAVATAFNLLRGVPIVYQGDEIGMANYPLTSPEEIKDVETGNAYLKMVSRDGLSEEEAFSRVQRQARDHARTPMQWNPGTNGGFTAGTPWFPLNPDWPRWNVAEQEKPHQGGEPTVLQWYRLLLELRRKWPQLQDGAFELVPGVKGGEAVLAYRRGGSILVVVNLSGEVAAVDLPAPVRVSPAPPELSPAPPAPALSSAHSWRVLAASPKALSAGEYAPGLCSLSPWQALVLYDGETENVR